MNSLPFYILGISFGFGAGILLMKLRMDTVIGERSTPDLLTLSPPLQEQEEDKRHDSLNSSMTDDSEQVQDVTEEIRADDWLDQIETDKSLKSSFKEHDVDDTTDRAHSAENSDQRLERSSQSEEGWMDGLRKTHQLISQSKNEMTASLPVVFDSQESGDRSKE